MHVYDGTSREVSYLSKENLMKGPNTGINPCKKEQIETEQQPTAQDANYFQPA